LRDNDSIQWTAPDNLGKSAVMGRPSRETVMTALFNTLVASVQTSFTADTSAGSVVLLNPSTTEGLFVGLPVVGGSIPRGTVIDSLSPLMLSQPAATNARAVALTTGFLTFSRRLKPWGEVSAQPALFLRDTDEDLEYPNTSLQIQTIKAEIWIYSQAGQNPDIAPITGLNNLLDAVQAALAPDNRMTNQFTLGGLVSWCRMVGKVDKSPGDLDGQAIAVADVEITVP
jgi:hypothetical protein